MPAFKRLILSGAASMGSDTLHRNRNTLTWICPIFVDIAILWIYSHFCGFIARFIPEVVLEQFGRKAPFA
jgi:hypothetical protein